jgi:hypothetical protein
VNGQYQTSGFGKLIRIDRLSKQCYGIWPNVCAEGKTIINVPSPVPVSVEIWTRALKRTSMPRSSRTGCRRAFHYDVKSGVVTLTGEVNSEAKRAQLDKLASSVPNVRQVVNELQVKDQKATSTE